MHRPFDSLLPDIRLWFTLCDGFSGIEIDKVEGFPFALYLEVKLVDVYHFAMNLYIFYKLSFNIRFMKNL